MSMLRNPEESIVDAALELPAHERATYLDKLCGNDHQLRQLVDALLLAHKKIISSQIVPPRDPSAAPTQCDPAPGEGAPERRVSGGTTMAVSVTPIEKPGDHIGRYKLLQQIGEGGGGIVYMAEQVEPVRRRVALKILKLGMDTRQVIARFEAERQALALMDHPNIAKVHDAGATETGRPYFVMELVRGVKITDYCDQNNLSTEKRLDLFIQTCKAIQHAHQKGVIHRDIKPSNILVTLHDGAPVPKVIDFGIAKATTGQPLTDKTVFTAFEQFIGTPAYMSPEQAEMSGLDIDTRSDIYSLGVLLYELLTGQMPFDPRQLAASGFEEMRRIIRTEDPLRPSTRLSNLTAADQTTAAKCRQVEAAKLINLVRGDLDWIVMKCLEKDRGRRYETPNGLARDVERHLNNDVIAARPPSQLYRIQKLVRRNKLAVGAGAMVLAASVSGLIGTSWQALRATRERSIAETQRRRAQVEAIRADANANAEHVQRKKAEEAARTANEALSMSLVVEAERLTREDAAGKALAYFARAVKLNPSNYVAATRIVSLLGQRSFPLPLATQPEGLPPGQPPAYSRRYRQGPSIESDPYVLKGRSIIERQSGRELSRVDFEGEVVDGPSFCRDGTKMVILTSANKINKIEIFFTKNGERVMPSIPAAGSGSPPFALFTPDGRRLIIGGKSSDEVEVWDLMSRTQPFKNLPHEATVFAMAVSADSRLLVTGVRTGEAHLWDLRTGLPASERCHGIFDMLETTLNSLGDFLIIKDRSLSAKGKAQEKWWDVRVGRAIPLTLWHSSAAEYATYSPAGDLVAVVCSDKTAWLWRSKDGSLQAQPTMNAAGVTKLAFSPNSSLLALGNGAGDVGLWDIQNSRLLWSQRLHSDLVSQLAFSSDGNELFSGASDKDGTVKMTHVFSGTLAGQITNNFGAVMSLAPAPDNRRLAIGYRLFRMEVWDFRNLQRLGEPLTRNGAIFHTCFSHSGDWLASSSGGDDTQLWGAVIPTNAPCVTYPHGHGHEVSFACFSPDDNLVLTGGGDRAARIWVRSSGQPVTEPIRHGAAVRTGCFGPDNRQVLTGSADGNVVVWDVRTGRALSDPFRLQGNTVSAAFSPDGKHILIAANRDRKVEIHSWMDVVESPPDWLLDLAEAVGGYHLNEQSVAEYRENAAQQIQRLRQTIAAADETSSLTRWGKWYLADRGTRSIGVDSTVKVPDYATHLAQGTELAALEEAISLNPTNGMAYAKLSTLLEPIEPETASLYREIAAQFGSSRALAAQVAKSPQPAKKAPISEDATIFDARDGSALLHQTGKVVRVKGEILVFGTSRTATFHYLNFAENYQTALTLAFRIADNPSEFRPELLRGYLNKTVVVEGELSQHLGVPQILMKSLAQIKVMEVPAPRSSADSP